ncbi:hypothetical protein [Inhella proteolytica]|uniref:Uncharacterized protein n=1 Tax=Inhella proteolytica TaxID=2795029 RepID=A0A931J159_9BURK|nr:hypothetical protein [Inhella proteolytica]MBH9576235.1 hypothetical protein [Inhella proteolytica]
MPLGGGTPIGQAVVYAAERIEAARRVIGVRIGNFSEGLGESVLISHVRGLTAQDSKVLG